MEGKTPTPACLVLISARLLLQEVASQIGSGAGAAVYLLVYDFLSLLLILSLFSPPSWLYIGSQEGVT